MPYFSFSLVQNFITRLNLKKFENIEIVPNKIYYSKNTKLWKLLNKKSHNNEYGYIRFEKRNKILKIKRKIIFLLPPMIGLGDAVEYALAINTIIKSKIFLKVGVAFVGRYKEIFKRYFNIKNIYEDVIEENELNTFDTLFHVSLEIDSIKNQKYIRSDIETEILKYFRLQNLRDYSNNKIKKIKTITIFPISSSPVRSMPIKVIKHLIKKLSVEYKLVFILDQKSIISNYIEKEINFNKCLKLYPRDLMELLDLIQDCQFGIFMDSGPLHVAKILRKPGILIESSVSADILLNNFKTINPLKNYYTSSFCNSPCGLTNIFNFKNQVGCFQSLNVSYNELLTLNHNSMQRGSLKDEYINFIKHPVGCLQNINVDNLINYINKYNNLI